jgi:hypothetical protein
MNAVAEEPLTAVPVSAERRAAVLLEALRLAAGGSEHRLFRGGKLPGLFASRSGPTAELAVAALADGLLEATRTEVRGKVVTEWVRLTPKGVRHLHATDSPQAVMRDLTAAVATTRAEVVALTAKLDALTARLEAAQRRADLSGLVEVVAWADAAFLHLDARPGVACSLAELFHSVADSHPELTLAGFHQGLLKLAEVRAVRLLADGPPGDPEYAVLVGATACHAVSR